MSKPLLSIGMIVKNESRCLERCLKALQPLRDAIPCQLVIADTGSDDGTQKIAERYADIFFDFPWINDFAAARNAVMDRCIGAWYLSLDADEYIDADVKELIAFLHSDAAKVCTSAFLIINNYSDPNDESQYSPFNASRLLNMSTKLRFEGAIHEVWPSVCMERPIYLENTVLWHDGYIRNGKLTEKKKGKRNMALIEAELEKTPNDLLRVMQALESSYTVEQAVKYAYRAVELLHQGAARAEILARPFTEMH